ncbi:hypothetical protein PHYSODRAFT_336032 [Phytophthora sojae]|uniref:Transmembrane protein n=1 Tax=Phytophthora sojae (strain P6497) TaxID=1094619 RepID=G4ZVP5_PHYSP|nr:hypothetical protein PHYSODRAFT_336032 [Phytophthora sojae]EGZ11510.1 hypothetical protein PHYSODRAFT_336032 [Phytophthora sojae]|eukprot:XP_009531843.1 hypothetical protein PHYSODRAFT_336032 [Phytophthora sojae]
MKRVSTPLALSPWEQLVVARFAYALFAVLSVHLVLLALCLAIVRRGQTLLFGQWEEISGVKLVAWAALLFYCGTSGLLALVLKSKRAAAKHALGCWMLLLVLHTSHLVVTVSPAVPHDNSHSWTTCQMMVQVLTDAMSCSFLVWLLRQRNGVHDKEDSLRQPLLPVVSMEDAHDGAEYSSRTT